MLGKRGVLLAAVIATLDQVALGQHGDFAPKVQLILDYLKESGEACMSPSIPGQRSFKACREGAEAVALTVVTNIPVRDDDGQAIDTCSAKLTATQVSGFSAVKMEVSARECPEATVKSGEFSRTFVGIILQLAEWVQKKEKPI